MPLIACSYSTALPCWMRGAQAALSPCFGAPATPVPCQAWQVASYSFLPASADAAFAAAGADAAAAGALPADAEAAGVGFAAAGAAAGVVAADSAAGAGAAAAVLTSGSLNLAPL